MKRGGERRRGKPKKNFLPVGRKFNHRLKRNPGDSILDEGCQYERRINGSRPDAGGVGKRGSVLLTDGENTVGL